MENRQGKLIVIEGTDCSGKETQTNILVENLMDLGYEVFRMPFPRYDTPTGRIIGGPILGKEYICPSYFEDAANIPPKVASLYYAADRLYHSEEIKKNLKEGKIVILDRYVESNMSCQGGKFKTQEERNAMYEYLETLEYGLHELARPDVVIFLHMPYEYSIELKKSRQEKLDDVEIDEQYLRNSESAYLEMKDKYNFKYIKCVKDDAVRSIEDISKDVLKLAKEIIDKN